MRPLGRLAAAGFVAILRTMQMILRRACVLALLLVLVATSACRSAPPAGTPDPAKAKRETIAKPWTKEAVEAHEHVYLELSTGKHGILFQPLYVADPKGDYLSSKNDANVHLALADVLLLDSIEVTQDESNAAAAAAAPVQTVAGTFAAFWIGVFLFVPAIALYLILF